MLQTNKNDTGNSKLRIDPEHLKTVKERYEAALDSFVEKLKQDRSILAAFLCGSLSYDEVWEKSNINVIIVTRDDVKPIQELILVEQGILIEGYIYTRDQFKKNLERALQGSRFHSLFSKSILLFSKDETLNEYCNGGQQLEDRDKEIQLLRYYTFACFDLNKAEKWLYVKKDIYYCFIYIMRVVEYLALLEVVLHGQIPLREGIQQALALNPSFFNTIYTDLIHQQKDEQALHQVMSLIKQYMDDKLLLVFRPVLKYLSKEGDIRSQTDLDTKFIKQEVWPFCWYLAEKGVVIRTSAPLKLTNKSTVHMDEPAYYYDDSMGLSEESLMELASKPRLDPKELKAITERYNAALGSFVEKLKQDKSILAAFLCGSLSYDEVWEKSDVDIIIVTRDDVKPEPYTFLVEQDIMFEGYINTRDHFKKSLERPLAGSIFRSHFSKSTLLFSKDETLMEYYNNIHRFGERDKEIQQLLHYSDACYYQDKAEKWLYIKRDISYCFIYIIKVVEHLARLEVVLHGQVPLREVIHQALVLNPSFFNAVYTDLIHQQKDEQALHQILSLINQYMDDKLLLVFRPVLKYLSKERNARSHSDLNLKFVKQGVRPNYYRLAKKGIVTQISAPLKLTNKSTFHMDEPAYYYDGSTNGEGQ
ncbi:MAG: hypothetical protein ACFFC7_09650 [Candidatus Hermodarchaeota archaeon]